MNMKTKFISQMQKKLAVSAVGPSAVRGQLKGTLAAARRSLMKLSLRPLRTRNEKSFGKWLDKQTDEMAKEIPWGVARKCLNLFLRDAFYNRYLHDKYGLCALEPMLEVPLDSVVGRFLIDRQNGTKLGPWRTLKGLKAETSRAFQEVASEIANAEGIARIHLDIFAWTDNR